MGRDRKVVDLPLDHPSCSKQHCVIQFRDTAKENEYGELKKEIRSVSIVKYVLLPNICKMFRLFLTCNFHLFWFFENPVMHTFRPYIVDLESTNGTYLNGSRIEGRQYIELFEKDILKFGYSTREWVLLHEESK